MKRKYIPVFLVVAIMISALYCKKDNGTEPSGGDKTDLGQGILVNVNALYPDGITTLFVNEGDTVNIYITSVLIKAPQYSFEPGETKLIKVELDAVVDTMATVIALGDSGSTTTLKIIDSANNASKTINVKIVKQWADPMLYDYIGRLNGHAYYFSKDKKTWVEAEKICREVGGYLATISSGMENTLLEQGRGRIDSVWIGISMYLVDKKWYLDKWANGEELTWQNFTSKPTVPGIFWEIYFYMDLIGKWESWHEQALYYFLEME
ncbi:C-type lectin domain-containing protein [candidate division KSB1 bacterium]|nr:C-type lectin domain-containing protein [candidate division KSB1 bacterium]